MKITSVTGAATGSIQVTFDDGSVWSCAPSGDNWRKQQLSFSELQAKFDAANIEQLEVASALKLEYAIQKPSTESVPVLKPPGDSETVGEGDAGQAPPETAGQDTGAESGG